MRRSRRGWSRGNIDIVAIALLELWGLIISLVAAYWVRSRVDLVADIFKTYLTVLLLPAVTGLLGFMRGESDLDNLPIDNAQAIRDLQRAHQRLRERVSDDPDNVYMQQTVERKISFPSPYNNNLDDPP